MIGYGNSNISTNFIASGLEAKHKNILQKEIAISSQMIMLFILSLPLMTVIWHLNIKQTPGIMGIES